MTMPIVLIVALALIVAALARHRLYLRRGRATAVQREKQAKMARNSAARR